jgi:tRNA 2-selenouridine synthase
VAGTLSVAPQGCDVQAEALGFIDLASIGDTRRAFPATAQEQATVSSDQYHPVVMSVHTQETHGRTPHVTPGELGIDEFSRYALIIDARTPHEYDEDHLPGAINLPVVDDAEFAEVGIKHFNDPHAAYVVGAAYASKNIADHIRKHISKYRPSDRLLVYCFRGGKRSRVWADTLRNIGFQTDVLNGGWKEYRRWVMRSLEAMPACFEYRVLAGLTGCGKTRLLHSLESQGNQVLDLEGIASHRGSLLGSLPGEPQPTQKAFDSLLLARLRTFDPSRPVWVEAESKKVGNLQLPSALFDVMRRRLVSDTDCVRSNDKQDGR